MDGTAIDTDIDRFIRQQKSKLAAERHDLQNDDEDYYPKRSPRRQWAEPNKENYLSVDVKRQTEEKPATPAHQGYPVDNRLVVKKRKELSVERKKEYNDFLKTQPNNQRKPRNLTPTQKSINVGEYDERRKAMLNAERKKDYDDFMRKSPEGLLIGETSTEHKEKLRQERQREYNEMMAQKRTGNRRRPPAENEDGGLFRNRPQSSQRQRTDRDRLLLDQDQSGGRRQWGNPTSTRPAEDQPKNPGGSGGYFPADNSHIHRQQMAEERKREYQEMLEAQKKKQQEQRMNRMNRNSNQKPTNPSIQPAQTQNPSDSSSQPAQFGNSTSPSNQAVHFQNPANQEPIPPEPPTESMPNGHGGPAYGDSNGLTSPRREARPPPQQGQTQSKEPRRRIWKEDSQIDFFASRYPDKRNYPTAQDGLNLNGAPSRQIENNGYVPSAADLETLERRKEYEEMLKNQSKPRNRTYREPENVDFMSSKYTKPPRQNKDPLMDFLQEGPHPTARENSQRNTDRPEVNYNNASLSPQEEMRNEYNNMLKNKTPRRLYKEPSKEDFFDFNRIQRNNPVERKSEPRLVDEERRREYQAMKKANPRSRPFRENSSDDFMKHTDSNRRVHGNGLSMTGSETFAEKERQYLAKVKASQQTPRRRMWREPTEDDFFISSRKYERQPQKRTSESFLL